MSEIVLGGRSKERFAMYLALAAAVSLWIVQIDFATIDFANLTASTLPTFVSASTLIAIVLYELRIDILLDKLTEYMSKKCEHHSSMLAAALEDPLVQHALWSTKTGVVAGLAIIVGVLRYFEAIELWQVLLAISAGLITIIASLARSDIRKLPFRVAILSRYFGMRERVSRDYRKSKQRAVSIEKVLEFCKQIEETLNERRWNLFVEQVESLQAVFPKIPP